jgi:hypothetical protein
MHTNCKSLLEFNPKVFTVYEFANKIKYGNTYDGGYVIGELNVNYDCYISCGLACNDDFSLGFVEKYNMNKSNTFGFDGTIENIPANLIDKMTFIRKNIDYDESDNTTNLSFLFEKYNNIFIKMDIEGGEWRWLLSMDEEKLTKITQLVIEFHGITNVSYHNNFSMDSFNCTAKDKFECLEKLTKTHYLIHAHGNNADLVNCNGIPNVIELIYINKKMFTIQPKLNSQNLPVENLDFPNEIKCKDVDLNLYPFVNKQNHFLINIHDKEEYTLDEYIDIHQQLNSKQINSII